VDADNFNNFIDDCLLIDLPICGQLFTWYRGDGISMSRLDRFLLLKNGLRFGRIMFRWRISRVFLIMSRLCYMWRMLIRDLDLFV